jgi:uncharacterized Fe-S cluster protein YjdI
MEKKIEYTNGELTIVWKPELCQHAGICVKMLPNVYHPKERPWVQIENATTEELIAQISKCPSGALSYRLRENTIPALEMLHKSLIMKSREFIKS